MAKASKVSGFWAGVKEIAVLLLIVFLIRTFGFGLYQVPTGSMETTMLVGERFFADKFTPLFSNAKHGDIISFNDPTFNYSPNTLVRLFQSYVWGPSNWTKRVIGVPGDEIKGVIENGKPVIYRNGKKLDEPYINKYPLIRVWNPKSSTLGDMFVRKSYVPTDPWDKQPFYNIEPSLICKKADGQPDISVSRTPTPLRGNEQTWSGGYPDEFHVKLEKNQYWVMGDNRLASHDSRYFGPLEEKLIHGKIIFRIFSVDSNGGFLLLDIVKNPIAFFKSIRWNRCLERVR